MYNIKFKKTRRMLLFGKYGWCLGKTAFSDDKTHFWWTDKDIDLEGIVLCTCQMCWGIKLKDSPDVKHHWLLRRRVMIALRFVFFLASGSHLQVIGDTMRHDNTTISRVIRQVTDALVQIKDTWTWLRILNSSICTLIQWLKDNHMIS